ncbi:hypothetical protein EB061_02145 [bacterium]|nr:hypothetical protein [bacterium]
MDAPSFLTDYHKDPLSLDLNAKKSDHVLMVRDLSLCFFLGVTLMTTLARAGNEHEHLQYLPTYSQISSAMNGTLGKRRASELISKDYSEITSRMGPVIPEEEFLHLRRTKNFEDFCKTLAIHSPGHSYQELMAGFFELRDWHKDAVVSYGKAGQTRSKLFVIAPRAVEPAILNAMNSAPRHQMRKCVFTIPKAMVDRTLLSGLVQNFDNRRMQAQFYYNVSRKMLSSHNTRFDKVLEQVKQGMREGWLHGVDISGSLWDSTFEYGEDSTELMRKRLLQLFEASSQAGIGVRLHAFENGTIGGFYDALWSALKECKKRKCTPNRLRIGHIYDLDDDSLERLLKYVKKSDVIFEVNAESNYALREPNTHMLVERIESMHGKGLRVAIGSDGIGILGERARFDASLSRFKGQGMSRRSLQKLIDEAYTPLIGSRFGSSAERAWGIEKRRVEEALGKIAHEDPPTPKCNPIQHVLKRILR